MSNEWVERAMELVEDYADKTSEYHHALRIDVGTHEAGATCVRAGGALWAHLEAKEREHQSDREVTVKVCNEMGALQALVKQLAEALERLLDTSQRNQDHYSEEAHDIAESRARAALAAYQEKT